MKKVIAVAVVVLGLGMAGYALAQSAAAGMHGGMMGQGMERMQGKMPMGGAMMSLMQGQPLTSEQLEQFAAQHGVSVEQAKQMTDTCSQIMSQKSAAPTPVQ
jgi:hypothetical protein